jgi:hypothetical protein
MNCFSLCATAKFVDKIQRHRGLMIRIDFFKRPKKVTKKKCFEWNYPGSSTAIHWPPQHFIALCTIINFLET